MNRPIKAPDGIREEREDLPKFDRLYTDTIFPDVVLGARIKLSLGKDLHPPKKAK